MSKDYTRKEVIEIVERTAARHGIPRDDFLRASYIETGGVFDEKAYNRRTGAAGLYQFMPDTAAAYGLRGEDVYDPTKSADAAARLYQANQRTIVASHDRTGRPYLSGHPAPDGLDMYLAHQQGAGGYTSIQAAISTGHFLDMKPSTRVAILANVDDRDLQERTGVSRDQLRAMSDKDMAQTFVGYWKSKYERISIPEVGVAPLAHGAATSHAQQAQKVQSSSHTLEPHWPAPGNHKINEADKPGEGRGEHNSPRSNRAGRHTGVDIQGREGDRIEAFAPGRVVFAGEATGYGKTVVIDHGNGQRTLYAHLQKIEVSRDQEVGAGAHIGNMGRTGNTPKLGDTHLHFEVRTGARAGEPFSGHDVDPMPYLRGQQKLDGSGARAQHPMADGVLKREERGDAVKHLQEALNKAGIRDADGKPLPTTGYFGEKTEAAVREYQRTHGLQVDGKAGHDTLTSLGLPTAQAAAEQKTTEQKAAEQKSAAAGAAQMSAAGEKPSVPPGQPDKLAQPSQADKPLISNPNHPDHRLYEQALSNLKQLGPSGGFKSDDERERAAAAVAADAKASGLKEITHISKSQAPNGESYLIAVQGDPTNPASKNAYLSYPQATQQTVEQSTRMAEATAPAQQQAQQQQQQQQTQQDGRDTSSRSVAVGR